MATTTPGQPSAQITARHPARHRDDVRFVRADH